MNKFLFFSSKEQFDKTPLRSIQEAYLIVYYAPEFKETPYYVAKSRWASDSNILVTRHEFEGILWRTLQHFHSNKKDCVIVYNVILNNVDNKIKSGYIPLPFGSSLPPGSGQVTEVVEKIKEKLDNMDSAPKYVKKEDAFEQKCHRIWLDAVFFASSKQNVPRMAPFTFANSVVDEFRKKFEGK